MFWKSSQGIVFALQYQLSPGGEHANRVKDHVDYGSTSRGRGHVSSAPIPHTIYK